MFKGTNEKISREKYQTIYLDFESVKLYSASCYFLLLGIFKINFPRGFQNYYKCKGFLQFLYTYKRIF